MEPLDTTVLADPESCRAAAAWVDRLAHADDQAAGAARRAASESETCWHGQAADAFRNQTSVNAHDVGELATAAERTASGLREFADQITTVRKRMEQARQVAAQAGLTITGSVIQPPVGGEAPMSPGVPVPAAPTNGQQQTVAFHEASGTVDDARRHEKTAHEALKSAMDNTNTVLSSLSNPLTWANTAVGAAGTLQAASNKLASAAEDRLNFAVEYERVAKNTGIPGAEREAKISQMLTKAGIQESQAVSNARALGNLGKTKFGKPVLDQLTRTVAGSSEGAGVMRSLGRMGFVAGLVGSTATTAQNISDGKPIGKSIEVNYGGWATSSVAAWGAGAALGALGVASAPATIVGVGVGFGVSWAWSYFQDHSLSDAKRDTEHAAGHLFGQS